MIEQIQNNFFVSFAILHISLSVLMLVIELLHDKDSPYIIKAISFDNQLRMLAPSLSTTCIVVFRSHIPNITFNQYGIPYFVAVSFASMILQDFLFWLQHFIHHRFDLLWREHRIHHRLVAGKSLNSTASFFASFIDLLLSSICAYSPALLFEVNFYHLIALSGIFGIWGIFIHHKFPRYLGISIINDPAHHHIHHGFGKENFNYGYYFNIFDIIFRTYAEPQSSAPLVSTLISHLHELRKIDPS